MKTRIYAVMALASLFLFALLFVGCANLGQPGATTQPATSQPSTQPDRSWATAVQNGNSGQVQGQQVGTAVGTIFGYGVLGGVLGGLLGRAVGTGGTLIFGSKKLDPQTVNVIHSVAQDVADTAPIIGVIPQAKVIAPIVGQVAGVVANATQPQS